LMAVNSSASSEFMVSISFLFPFITASFGSSGFLLAVASDRTSVPLHITFRSFRLR
jgi:hypothetical protein